MSYRDTVLKTGPLNLPRFRGYMLKCISPQEQLFQKHLKVVEDWPTFPISLRTRSSCEPWSMHWTSRLRRHVVGGSVLVALQHQATESPIWGSHYDSTHITLLSGEVFLSTNNSLARSWQLRLIRIYKCWALKCFVQYVTTAQACCPRRRLSFVIRNGHG